MNVGFREAMREEDWDCLFFHDVDLIPEDDRNTYMCDANPKHTAIAMDKFGYKSVYSLYFGFFFPSWFISSSFHCKSLLDFHKFIQHNVFHFSCEYSSSFIVWLH